MMELLFPTTDSGVLVQLIVTTAAFIGVQWWLRRQSEWRVFATGIYVLGLAFFGLRALH